MLLTISEITVLPGRRQTKPEQVQELSRSISEIGLLNPITIDKEHTLIAGLNRLEAVKLLGWTEIDCTVTSLEGLKAELAEIDENFVRNSVSDMELGEMLLRRKEIYETLHPETKAGIAQAAGMNRAIGNNVAAESAVTSKSFVEDTADKLGMAPRTVREHIQTARDLAPETKNILKDANIKLTKKAALQLARLEPEQQKEAAEMLASKEIHSIDEYHTYKQKETGEIKAEPPPSPDCPGEQKPEALALPSAPVTSVSGKQDSRFREIAEDLKNSDNGQNYTPDIFLTEIADYVAKFHSNIMRFDSQHPGKIFSEFSATQYEYLCEQMKVLQADVEMIMRKAKNLQNNPKETSGTQ